MLQYLKRYVSDVEEFRKMVQVLFDAGFPRTEFLLEKCHPEDSDAIELLIENLKESSDTLEPVLQLLLSIPGVREIYLAAHQHDPKVLQHAF